MSELFKVHVLPSNIRTCFFYLNDSDLEYYERHGRSIKIRYGTDHRNLTYGCISSTSLTEIPSKCVGVCNLFANKLGLKENEGVLLSNCDVDSINNLQILPEKEEDYVILLSCKSLLETYLLNQVSVVAEGQVLPLFVFSNIFINVEIGKLNVESGYGQLEQFTEIAVLHPLEKPRKLCKSENRTVLGEDNKKEETKNFSNVIYNQLSQILKNRINLSESHKQKNADSFLKHLKEENSFKNTEYKIQPSFLFLDSTFKDVQNRFVIVSNFESGISTFGPYCVKILVKVEKVTNIGKEKHESEYDKEKDKPLYIYVISLNSSYNNTAFCPPQLMKKLNLFVGSKITIEQIKATPKVELPKWLEKINYNNEDLDCFWKRIAGVRDVIRLTIINNFKYNYKINTLIVGGPGTGKTFLLDDILNEFTNNFIFCKKFNCKTLRAKKIENLHKLWIESLRECAYQEPSLLVLDDLHAVTYIDEEEGPFNRLYSERVVDLLSDLLENFQGKYNISVVASAVSLSQLSSVVSQHGPRLFHDVLQIPEMNFDERNFALKYIMNRKVGVSKSISVDLDKISGSTSGYTIQDLCDLIDRAIFNCLLRSETHGDLSNMTQDDIDVALSETIPLNLRNAKLKQNIQTKWENVGGMSGPKETLMEVFSWPMKYPSILESCPLRLQRGVLLYGAPGTGKTLLAGALANKCGLNFISVKGPEILSKYVGASEEGVRNLFVQAERAQPCLLFFDEFDSLAPKRGHDNTGVTDRVVNQLLTQLDGVESLNGVWVLAATSRPDLLDPALLRPGRLDKMVFCDFPNEVDRISVLEVLSQNLSKAEDVNFLEIAKNTDGYTGADLQAILYNAQMLAIKEEKNSLSEKSVIRIRPIHLTKALSEEFPTVLVRGTNEINTLAESYRIHNAFDYLAAGTVASPAEFLSEPIYLEFILSLSTVAFTLMRPVRQEDNFNIAPANVLRPEIAT